MIVTFYSFKGGVGRSMALANLAVLFVRAGLRVLAVDWDLEAPGLEQYFFDDPTEVYEQSGLVDMLIDYKVQMTRDPEETEKIELHSILKYIIHVDLSEQNPGKLMLLSAGRRTSGSLPDYAQAVLNFDWQGFYSDWEGEIYFEWLRGQFEQIADIILIDSRTGISEMGGVCTYQLADVIVAFCAANQQSIIGTRDMVRNFASSKVQELRPGRPLELIIVPARVEDRAEVELHEKFRRQFASMFDKFLPARLEGQLRSFWDLKIPYLSYYAFNETIAILGHSPTHEDLTSAYLRLGKVISLLTGHPVSGSKLFDQAQKQGRKLRNPRDFTVQILNNAGTPVGAGTIVDLSGRIVTCNHVVQTGNYSNNIESEVKIYFPQLKQTLQATIIAQSQDDDLALLQVSTPLTLGTEHVAELGSPEDSYFHTFVSYGYTEWGGGSMARGTILGTVEPSKDQSSRTERIALESNQISVGMSGSPVLDSERNVVVGIISNIAMPDRYNRHRDTAFAIDARALQFTPFNIPLRDDY